MTQQKTIICLAAKRSGTTAIHAMFVNHPDVGVCHPDQSIKNWEPNFWNFAAGALRADSQQAETFQKFQKQLSVTAPFLKADFPLTEEKIFGYWDAIAEAYGPVVFEKSPNYLHDPEGLELLLHYIQRGADVRIFGLVRDPRDAISSQYELWKEAYKPGTPQFRDSYWVEHYRNFESFQSQLGKDACPLIRYEDLAADPQKWCAMILEHSGVANLPNTYAHIRPVHVGRYEQSEDKELANWDFSSELVASAKKYGYYLKKASPLKKTLSRVGGKTKRLIGKWVNRFGASAVKSADALPLPKFEAFLLEVIRLRLKRLSPEDALKFLFRLDDALYHMQGRASVNYGGGIHTKHRHMKYHDFFTARISSADVVMDIGCGIGAVAYDVAGVAARVVGMDFNAASIETARKQFSHPNLEYRVGDALETLPDERYSVVILSNVLEHLPGRPAFLRRVQQALNPQRILIRIPLFERDWRVPLKKELGVEWRLDATHETEYTLESFAQEMEEAGLKVTHLEARWGEIWAEVTGR